MAPKGNAKATAAREAKAERENVKKGKAAAEAEAKEAAAWETGAKGKGKKEDKAAAAEEARAKKAERDRLLAEEEASQPSKAPKGGAKAGAKKTVPSVPSFNLGGGDDDIASFSASGIDDALDALSLATSRTDKAFVGSQAAKIETHPERRFPAAYAAYKEEQLPLVKKDHPGLRLQQYEDLMFKNFKKDPRNPYNQVSVQYNATKEDKVAALEAQKAEMARRLAESEPKGKKGGRR
ncbi:hypothetical protein JCM8097_005372 [Rhodosporidiobolus ruineniae]